MDSYSDSKKVAVIAVHGVSDQKQEESAEAIAKLLHRHYSGDRLTASRFNKASIPKQDLSIPVAPVKVSTSPASDDACSAAREEPWYTFMDKRLVDYKGGEESCYETVKFSVSARQHQGERDIHVYEMYWADLSRLGNGVIRFFGSFFQLLFHLSNLGGETLRLAQEEARKTKDMNGIIKLAFSSLERLHSASNVLMTLVIPTLVLGLLTGSLLSLPRLLPRDVLGLIDSAAIFIVFYAAVYLMANRLFAVRSWRQLFFWSFFCLPGIAALTIYLVTSIGNYKLSSILWLVILIAICFFLFLKPYQKRDDRLVVKLFKDTGNEKKLNWPLLLLASFIVPATIFLSQQNNDGLGIAIASFHQVELAVLCLAVAWLIFNTLHLVFALIAASLIFFLKIIQTQNLGLTIRLNRAIWTGLVSLSAPSSIFFIVNAMFWAALVLGVSERLLIDEPGVYYQPIIFTHADRFIHVGERGLTFFNFAEGLLKMTATSGFLLVLLLMAGVLIGAIWSFLPSLLYEASPKGRQGGSDASEHLGGWLSTGLASIASLMLVLLTSAMAVVFTLACYQGLLDALFPQTFHTMLPMLDRIGDGITSVIPRWLKEDGNGRITTERVLFLSSTLTVGGISLLISLGDRAEAFLALFRSVLDAVLDVDNHLRLHPKDCNPRAQIAARYVSLLRFISQQNCYDKIIIVAHSQGTVISADLLRYLHCNPDPQLASLPEVKFFTMGCPLRQLYSFGFPHLYRWMSPDGEQLAGQTIVDTAKPNPAELFHVTQWVNVFGSGDYIGRDLWRTGRLPKQWTPGEVFSGAMRKEYCLGAGAHTHYWDGTFPRVAEELGELIG